MTKLLAVDAGGTSTRAIVLTTAGDCVGFGMSGAGNPISSGPEHVARQVAAAAAAALAQASVAALDGTAVLAMAGSRVDGSTAWITPELERIGVRGPIRTESDLLATFCAGAWEADGYALVAGTGAAAIRVRAGRQEAVSDGIGWLLGDAGSGFWIGRRVARAVAAQLDRRGPETALTGPLLALFDIPQDADGDLAAADRAPALRALLEAVYAARPIELARLAPLAFAAGGDPVATGIRDDARAALRTSLAAVQAGDVRGPVVCGGGVLGALGIDADGLPAVTGVRTVADGAVGAAVLALRENGVEVGPDVFARVRSTLAALRAG